MMTTMKMMGLGTDLIMGLLMAVVVVFLSVLITEEVVYAQTSTTQQVIELAQTDCSLVTTPELASLCVSVLHESSRTIVLQGELLIVNTEGGGGYTDNPYIWQAVDGLKAQGYTLHSVLLSGQGTQGNPHSWYIVMSR